MRSPVPPAWAAECRGHSAPHCWWGGRSGGQRHAGGMLQPRSRLAQSSRGRRRAPWPV